jgi:dihydroorotase
MVDLILKGGRVIDPSQGIDKLADVAFAGGKVVEVGSNLPPGGAEVQDVSGLIVTPGLIDLHTHVYWGGTSVGVDAEALARTSATTTFVDAGTAGPANFLGFRKHVIERSAVRILPYLNVSFAGIFGFGPVMFGECSDLRLINLREWARVAAEHRDMILGIKVRVGASASGSSGIEPLDMALEAAEELGLPMMAHLDAPPPSARQVLTRLRKGDVLTHCFRPYPNAPVRASGRIRDEVMEARARGVVFDIGHGAGSFGFATTRRMLEAGFLPDTISSDVHSISINGPAFDLLHTMSKFLCLGLDLPTVIKAATCAPAAAVGKPELGTFKAGSVGDASILAHEKGTFDYVDVIGETIKGDQRLAARGVVINGRWWHSQGET